MRLVSLLLISAIAAIYAQTNSYWQQRVHYQLKVELDDRDHRLIGEMTLRYTNNSPDTLYELYFHVYPNAFRNNESEYAREQIETGNLRYLFADEDERGALYGLAFEVNGEAVAWEWTDEPDIVRVPVPEGIKPGQTVTITTPFEVKIPIVFSRLGRDSQAYMITQWYPRVAVYDRNGWHLLPYRDQGEFYGEFGTYEVDITVPANYVVLATGTLETASERAWLLKRVQESRRLIQWLDSLREDSIHEDLYDQVTDSLMRFPPSATAKKTLRWIAHNVHDFAWFADKRWLVDHDSVRLPTGKVVQTWAAFLPASHHAWQKAVQYLDSSLYYYSLWIGEYAWPQATAVEGPLKAGGGMEYPMITIISEGISSPEMVERVIAHEVGHNWFMGMLATNERYFPWMDEGINSYYEWRYMEPRHGVGYDTSQRRKLEVRTLSRRLNLSKQISPRKVASVYYVSALLANLVNTVERSFGIDQPMDLHADKYARINYGTIIYMRVPLMWQILEAQLGRENLDKAMQHYFQQWKFKHPYPEDLQRAFQQTGLAADWFFDVLLSTPRFWDWRFIWVTPDTLQIGNRRYRTLFIQSRNHLPGPFQVAAYKGDSLIETKWYYADEEMVKQEAFDVIFPAGDYDRLVINPFVAPFIAPDESYRENQFRLDKKWRWTRRKVQFHLLGGFSGPAHTVVGWLPFVGWNEADGLWAGIYLNNYLFKGKRLEWMVLPAYAFKSRRLVGFADVGYYFYPQYGRSVHYVRVGVEGRTFGLANGAYRRVSPHVRISFVPESWHRPLFTFLNLRAHWIETPWQSQWIGDVQWHRRWTSRFNPYEYEFRLLGNDRFARLHGTWTQQFTYNRKGKTVGFRLFAGYAYRTDTTTPSFTLSAWRGHQDFLFEHYYLSRLPGDAFVRRQVYDVDGGFYTPTAIQARSWLASVRLFADLPFGFPLRLYGTLGLWDNAVGQLQTGYEAGLTIGGRQLAVHIPVVVSPGLVPVNPNDDALRQTFQRVTFTLNLDWKPHLFLRDFRR